MEPLALAQLGFAKKLGQFVVKKAFQEPGGITQRSIAQRALDPRNIQVAILNLAANQIECGFRLAPVRALDRLGFFLASQGCVLATFSAI